MVDKTPTPKTDAYKGTHETHRINGKTIYDHAEQLEQELTTALIPICIGRPIIQILAKEGQWFSENGNGLIAADCLFKKDPYVEQDEVRETLTLTLQDHDRLLQENYNMHDAIRAAYHSLTDLVEHIGECDESDLLRCDSDPHRPSVFSVYADRANVTLTKLKPFLKP